MRSAVAWAALLAIVVGVGVAGGSRSDQSRQAVVPTPVSAAPSLAARATADPDRPRAVLVRGWVAETAGHVRIMVTTGSRVPIATAAIDPTGMPRNGMIPFETTFRVPRAVANLGGGLFVLAVGAAGNELESTEWLAVEGAIVEMVVR